MMGLWYLRTYIVCVGLNACSAAQWICNVSRATVSYSLSAWHSYTP
jgi:hypothetical protein